MENYTGQLSLAVKERDNKTVPAAIFFQGALKVMRPQYLDDSGQVTFYLLNPGGGYLDGDRYAIKVELEKKAQLFLTTQSATKIYQTPTDYVAQCSEFILAEDSELVNLPDPIIPYENSRYYQEQNIYLAAGASCFTSEILTPGWDSQARGFTYKEINLLTKIYQEKKLVVMDRLYFQPTENNVAGLGMLEGYKKVASLLVLHEEITPAFISLLREKILADFPKVKFGISALPVAGFSLRALGDNTQELEALIYLCYEFYSNEFCQGRTITQRKY